MSVLLKISPISPVLKHRSFDHGDYLFELKYDGFRSVAYVQGGRGELVSRNSHIFHGFKVLAGWLAENLRVRDAIIDGETCCLDESRKSCFNDLMGGTREPYFAAFDLLWLNGEDLRTLPLIERKRRLRRLFRQFPRSSSTSIMLKRKARIDFVPLPIKWQ
jgi:bifunctional non-homologous end joining protein LigD